MGVQLFLFFILFQEIVSTFNIYEALLDFRENDSASSTGPGVQATESTGSGQIAPGQSAPGQIAPDKSPTDRPPQWQTAPGQSAPKIKSVLFWIKDILVFEASVFARSEFFESILTRN